MKSSEIELDATLIGLLNQLRMVSPLSPQIVAEERNKFLAHGEIIRLAISQQPRQRQIGWINNFVFTFKRKERIPMLNTLMIIILSLCLLFGSTGAAVYAAQYSLPDDMLYPVKAWSEDVRFSMTGSSQGKLDLILEFTDQRMAEIARMLAAEEPISAGIAARFQDELDIVLQLAAGMNDKRIMQALVQIRHQAEIQSQSMMVWMGTGSGRTDPELARLQERLQEQLQLAAIGESDPQGFRLQVRERLLDRQNMPSQTPNSMPDPTGSSYGPGEGSKMGTPGGPNPSQTPMPTGGSYGPGPSAGHPSTTPGGYGPGPNAGTTTCIPAQTGSGFGPPTSQTQQSGGSGSPNPGATMQPGGPGSESGNSTSNPQHGGMP